MLWNTCKIVEKRKVAPIYVEGGANLPQGGANVPFDSGGWRGPTLRVAQTHLSGRTRPTGLPRKPWILPVPP